MRIAINCKDLQEPIGGAHQFASNLTEFLTNSNHYVTRQLETNIDLILIVVNHNNLKLNSFSLKDIYHFKKAYPSTLIIQRVNASDEQRGAKLGQNEYIEYARKLSDHTIFVSEFMKNFWIKKNSSFRKDSSVILNGSNSKIFGTSKRGGEKKKIKIITHHWSQNFLKGFDIYQRFDEILEKPQIGNKVEFIYLGNIPAGFRFKNTTVIKPMKIIEVAKTLKKCDGYLTASRLEPGGNHVTEALMSGLPVLYLNNGSHNEYCKGFGVRFSLSTFEQNLKKFIKNIDILKRKTLKYNYNSEKMSEEYEQLFNSLLFKKNKVKSYPLVYINYRIIENIKKFFLRILNYVK